MKKKKKKPFRPKRLLVALALLVGLALLACVPLYFLARQAFNSYFDKWGDRLVALEKKGLLSKQYGAAWQDVLADEAMEQSAARILADSAARAADRVAIVDGVALKDYPSLSIIKRLNEVQAYSNSIEITDRLDRRVALIRTNHTRGKISEFPPVLVNALIAAEDSHFRQNRLGFEFNSYVRACLGAVAHTLTRFSASSPQGTSTITQQVAKLFISDIDVEGRRTVSHSLDRKIREMRIAAALRKMYSPDEILEVYLNHCVTSDYGLVGFKDIAAGLFGKRLSELTDAECIYLARMVKWGRHVHPKIVRQCRIDMPRMAAALGWDRQKQAAVLAAIDTLKFQKPAQVETEFGPLVDCANEFWQQVIARSQGVGGGVNAADMDIIDPSSLIRKKGNLKIKLTIDLPLQRELQRLVDGRGYGKDTVIASDVRIGSAGSIVTRSRPPRDTLRHLSVLKAPRRFGEQGSAFETTLAAGDTLVANVRYAKAGPNSYRRSCFYYTRRKTKVDGQYFAYCILDSKSGKLLAYYSHDKIGSRLLSLLRNRTPNGSSTAKPIFHSLNFDLGNFKPYDMWTDSLPVSADVAWKRTIDVKNGKPEGVIFEHSAVPGRGYPVNNHLNVFDGCQYLFDQLAASNNILGVEMVYRLNTRLFDAGGAIDKQALPLSQLLYRIGALDRIKDSLGLKTVTGVRIYKEIARILGVDVDSVTAYGRRVAVSDSLYSVGLGTLELTLYEQAHLFNMLYNNDLIEKPAQHPGLVIDDIVLNNRRIPVADADTVKRYHPFGDINNLRPVYLGLHKRLVSNAADGLTEYDVPCPPDKGSGPSWLERFDPEKYPLDGPPSNFAKSGTSDDVLRPFNVDVTSDKRTNYGLWNAVIRVNLAALADSGEPDIRDITLACIGECSTRYTGERDGKTLHKFLSREILKKAGVKSPGGYFSQYEGYLKRVTPNEVKCCGQYIKTQVDEKKPGPFEKLWNMLPFHKRSGEAER